jgi:hypothetical protein
MDCNQRPDVASSVAGRGDDELQNLLAFCAGTLRDMRQAGERAGIIEAGIFEQYRRLDELRSAMDTLLTRLQLAVLLGRLPGVTSGPGRSPMDSEAVERIRRAINVIAGTDN